RGVVAAGTGARRMFPSVRRCHFPYSSMGCVSVSSHSPLSVSVTVQDCGEITPRPLPEKSVHVAEYTQIMRHHLPPGHEKAPFPQEDAISLFLFIAVAYPVEPLCDPFARTQSPSPTQCPVVRLSRNTPENSRQLRGE